MMKFNKKMAAKIVELWGTGEHSIVGICEAVNISRDTFYKWKKRASFEKALSIADAKRLDHIKDVATSGLMTLLRGKEYEEVTTEYVESKPDVNGVTKPKIKSQKKVKRIVLPSASTVIFVMKNLDQVNFPNTVSAELSGKGGVPLAPALNITTVDPGIPMAESEDEAELQTP